MSLYRCVLASAGPSRCMLASVGPSRYVLASAGPSRCLHSSACRFVANQSTSAQSKTSQPTSAQSKASQPTSAQSKASQPKSAQSKTSQPKSAKSKSAQSKSAKSKPKSARTYEGQSKSKQLELDHLGTPMTPSWTPKRAKEEMDAEAEYAAVKDAVDHMHYQHLPPRKDWKAELRPGKTFQSLHRYFVSNQATVHDLIASLDLDSAERNGEKVTVIEGYPGAGTVTSELLKLPQVEKVIALEEAPGFVSRLKDLQALEGDRLDIVPASVFLWTTFDKVVQDNKLAHLQGRVATDGGTIDFCDDKSAPPDHNDSSWKQLSPIVFVAQLPNTVYGEQLFAQIITSVASRSWFFRFGRIKMAFVCGEPLARRLVAQPGESARGKLGTTAQTLGDIEVFKMADDLRPHSHHFFPAVMSIGPRTPMTHSIPNSTVSHGRSRHGWAMVTFTPRVTPLVTGRSMEAFEFILRNVFVLKASAVGEALTHVAPGAENLLKKTGADQVEAGLICADEVVLPHQRVDTLTNTQWACLARMFDKWPFRPKNLFEQTGFLDNRSN